MNVKPRLFISHSHQELALTEAIVAELAGSSFELLWDKVCLQPGEAWQEQLHAMMAYAHAGLLLLTPGALARPEWVRKEAYILTWRQSLDPSFKVFYSLIGGVSRADLERQGLAPAHLGRIQALSGKDAVSIGKEVSAHAPAAPAETPLEQLAFYLSQALKLEGEALKRLAVKLGVPELPWLPPDTKQDKALRTRVAARLIVGELGTLGTLSGVIQELDNLSVPRESFRKILRWVGPHWVPAESCGRLAAISAQLWSDKTGGWAVINGNHVVDYTARMFVNKARPFDSRCEVLPLELPDVRSDAEYYTSKICDHLLEEDRKRPRPERLYPATRSALLEYLKQQKPFLFVPIGYLDDSTMAELRAQFPKVVFLVWTGPELLPVGSDPPALWLEPAVDRDRESSEYLEWLAAAQVLQQQGAS